MNQLPEIYELPEDKKDILSSKFDFTIGESISYPKFSLGFQHYLHQSKGKMEITKKFEGKKKVYYVLNPYEKHIDNYDKDLASLAKLKFKGPDIICRAFFKLWEIFKTFDIVPLNKPGFVSAHLAEGPGSFIQATILFRDTMCKKGISKNDKYHGITLFNETKKNPLKMEDKFVKYYEKEKPQRFYNHKTYPAREASRSSTKDNGDLTSTKTINLFAKHFSKNKAQLVTADGGFDWQNESLQEQEVLPLLLGQIITALKIQDKGGNFVCKCYETFTIVTVKLLAILKAVYKNVALFKPLTSRRSNSEKYIVCMGYKGMNTKDINNLENMLESMKRGELQDLYTSYELSDKMIKKMIELNTQLANKQFQAMNEIVAYIKKENYLGEEYNRRRADQIEATKFWSKTYFEK